MMATAERSAHDAAQRQPVHVNRVPEQVIAVLGMLASTVFLGGFTAAVNGLDEHAFTDSGLADLIGLQNVAPAQAYELASTLAAWFGFTLIAVLLLAVVGLLATRRRPWRRYAGWWFLAAGLVCLLGSQLILYPVAFIFFVCAGFFALRPVEPRSLS